MGEYKTGEWFPGSPSELFLTKNGLKEEYKGIVLNFENNEQHYSHVAQKYEITPDQISQIKERITKQ